MNAVLILVLNFWYISAIAQINVHVIDQEIASPTGPIGVYRVSRGGQMKSSLPSPQVRDSFFSQFTVTAQLIKNWDEVKKDLLWIDLENYPIEKLEKKYDKLPAKELSAMKTRRNE